MSYLDIFGPMINLAVGPSRAVETHLRTWLDTYLVAYEEVNGLVPHTYARPQSWLKVNLLEGIPGEDMSPTVIIASRGANGTPTRRSGHYDIMMDVGIAVVTTSFEGDGAREVAGAIGTAIVLPMLHKNLAAPKLKVISWDEVRLDDLSGEEAKTRAILRLAFTVAAEQVFKREGGPAVPDAPHDDDETGTHFPPNSLPTVQQTITTVTKEDPS
jgi:hypothetical protein